MMAGSKLYSQPGIDWTARFNGLIDSTDVARDIVVDNSGNTYVTGYSSQLLGLFTSIITISYDSNGNQRWLSIYDQPLFDEGNAIALDNTGQYVYVTGFSFGLLTLADYVLIKMDASTGNIIWSQRYDSGLLGDDRAVDVIVDYQNNPVITGYSYGGLLSEADFYTIKYGENGNLLWGRRYNNPAGKEDIAYALASDNGGNIYVSGYSNAGLLLANDNYTTLKYDPAGNQQWVASYNGPGNNQDRAYAIVVDNSGNPIVTGSSRSGSTESTEDYATVKYDPNGNQQWVSRYNGPGNNQDRAYAIVVDNSGNTYVTGESMGNGSDMDYSTVKYNQAGSQQWASRYNGPGNNQDRAYAIVVDNSGNSYVTGSSRSGSTQSTEDYATVKYDPSGAEEWRIRYDGSGGNEDRAYAIVVDNSNNVYVTGQSRNGALLGSEDYLTIKYNDGNKVIGIISNEIPMENKLSVNYPNPFNPSTNIRFDLSESKTVSLVVYDINGHKVESLVQGKLNAGSYEIKWNASKHPSGVYFYRINAGHYSETKKMILIK
jgi:hypothetical protein